MKKLILTCLCSVAMLATLCATVEARLLIGYSPATLARLDQQAADTLAKALSSQAGTTVTLRRFDNEATLSGWLLRFQEIDAAVVSPALSGRQAAGTLQRLADLHLRDGAAQPAQLVVRGNLDTRQATAIREAFLKLDRSEDGRKAISRAGLAGVTAPGSAIARQAKEVPSSPASAPAKATAPETTVASETPASPQPVQTPAIKKSAPPTKSDTAPEPLREKAAGPPPAEKVAVAPVQESPPAQPPASAEPQPKDKRSAGDAVAKGAGAPDGAAPGAAQREKSATDTRLSIFIVLVILLAVLLKVCLLVLRWRNKRATAAHPGETPTVAVAMEAGSEQADQSATPPAPQEDVPPPDQTVESGTLGPGKVPALLKRCAELPEPVTLHVTKGTNEKLVGFAGGQITGALTRKKDSAEAGVRWSKLGGLLMREELITGEQYEQAMAMAAGEPTLSFGEALLKLELLDRDSLRQALSRQTKATIYSLILFPEGRYTIAAGNEVFPPDEQVALDVTGLIREASHHQSEWTGIRQALPRLNTALKFTDKGREKLAKVALSPQQEATLGLVDGKRTINDLCAESTMLDYEIYRFLYLMVKTGVMK